MASDPSKETTEVRSDHVRLLGGGGDDVEEDVLRACGRRRERGARDCGRRIPGRARRAAQGLRCAAPALLGWGEEGAVVVGIGAGLRVFWQDSNLRRKKKRFSLQISIFSNESEGSESGRAIELTL